MHERWWFAVHQAVLVTLFACSTLSAASASQESIRFTACDDNRGYCVTNDQCSVRLFPSLTSRCPRHEEVCCPKSSVPSANDLPAGRCGVRKTQINKLILGGRKVPDGKWPWHAAIAHRTGRSTEIKCGGSIIDKATILTAAHCLYEQSGVIARYRVLVHVGRTHQFSTHCLSKTYKPDHFIIHPGYRQHSVTHDIALIKLGYEIEMNDFVQPVCLWPTGTDQERVVGRTGHVVGCGLHNQTHASDDLLEAKVPVVDLIECLESNRRVFGPTLTSQMLCAGALNDVGPCNGDSGGGFFLEINNVWHIRAIVSFAPNLYGETVCDPEQYTIYTDVSKHMQWIFENQHEPSINRNNIRISSSTTSKADKPNDTQPPKTPNKLLPAFESESEASEEKCGQRNINGVGVQKINEELLTKYGEFPWMVALFSHPEAQFCCNGALVGTRAILTTAHCVDLCRNSTQNVMVRVGEWDMSKTEAMPIPPESIIVSSAHLHKNYNPSSHVNNIALLELDHPVRYRATVQPVCLPSADYEVRSSENLIAIGWGATLKQQQMISPVLKRLDLQNVEQETCKSQLKRIQGRHRFVLDSGFVCAFTNHPKNERPCDGYAGSSVIVEIPGKTDQYYLHGLVLWGFNCHERVITHTALIKVLHYLNWIKETMSKFN